MKRKYLLFFLTLILNISIIYSINVDVDINENIYATELESGNILIISNGIINITNPSSSSEIYEFGFNFSTDLYLYFSTTDTKIKIADRKLLGRNIDANSSYVFDFSLSGTISKLLYTNFTNSNTSLFNWYTNNIYFDPLRQASLNKFDRENSSNLNESSRFVTVNIFNPTEFNVNLNYLNLIKTNTTTYLDFYEDVNKIDSFYYLNISPYSTKNFSHFDILSDDMSIYWIEYDINAIYGITQIYNISYAPYTATPSTNSGSSKGSSGGSTFIPVLKNLEFYKHFNQSTLLKGEKIKVHLNIQNLNNYEINNLTIIDYLPQYFKFVNISLSEINISFDKIYPFETKTIEYELIYLGNNDSVEIMPIQSAKLSYGDKIIYSNSLSVYLQKIYSEKRLMIMKEIFTLENEFTRVEINIKNIGDIDFENFILVESLNILNVSEKFDTSNRHWRIPNLRVGDSWETIYIINNSEDSFILPDIYGIDEVEVYKTLIVNNEIILKNIKGTELKPYQKILIGLAGLLLIIDILF